MHFPTPTHLIKSTGEREPFSEEKLRESLKRSGTSVPVIDRVTQRAVRQIRRLPQTEHLFDRVQTELVAVDPASAIRYGLRRSILRLGPTGHPFESYFGAVLEAHGYKTQVSVLVDGHCVTHEVDIVAEKDKERIMLECKFHNRPGLRSTVKDSLYIHARYLDVKDKDITNACCVFDPSAAKRAAGPAGRSWQDEVFPDKHAHVVRGFTKGGLVTNTKVTLDARAYAACVGLLVIGWRYPEGKGVEQFIESKQMYPVTAFTELQPSVLALLFERGIYTIRDFLELAPQDLERLVRLRPRQLAAMRSTAKQLLEG